MRHLNTFDLLFLTFFGLDGNSGGLEQKLVAGDSGVIHHAPTDVGLHCAPLLTLVDELDVQFEIITNADLQGWQDHVHIGQRGVGLLLFAAILLCFLQDRSLLWGPWFGLTNRIHFAAKLCLASNGLNCCQNQESVQA